MSLKFKYSLKYKLTKYSSLWRVKTKVFLLNDDNIVFDILDLSKACDIYILMLFFFLYIHIIHIRADIHHRHLN